jgi:pyruvate dehydrogenase E1 component beta subunit/2-oxoisovalerate dehydrogenase E1 component
MFDAQLYRAKEEVEEWRKRGPILRFQTWLLENGMIHQEDVTAIETEIRAEIDEAVAFAEAGQWEPLDTLTRHVYAADATNGATP